MKKIEYVQVGDYLLLNLKADKIHLDRFGRAKLEYLKKYDIDYISNYLYKMNW